MSRGVKLDLFVGANIEDGWQKLEDEQTSSQREFLLPKEHSLVIKKEKRGSKVVTVAGEFFLCKDELELLLASLKKSLGCGGAIKENSIELQGLVEQKITDRLNTLGFGFKKRKN